MKRIAAIMLTLALMLSVTGAALAANHGTKGSSAFTPDSALDGKQEITIVKGYAVNDEDDSTDPHPADTLVFSVESSEYYFNGKLDESVTVPELTITNPTVEEGTAKAELKITLPDYTGCKVGEYVYFLTEEDAKTAGVTYNYTSDNPLVLKVTLINETDPATGALSGNVIIGAIALRDGGEDGVNPGNIAVSGSKLDSTTGSKDDVHNEYEKGKVTVEKTVTGNMGDTTKPWIFKAEFKTTNSETVRGTVKMSGTGTYYGETAPEADENGNVTGTAVTDKTIAPAWTTKTVYFTLTSGQNFTFDNVPEGVEYTVTEVEADAYGYTTTIPTSEAAQTMTADGDVTASFVNDKSQTPDTGLSISSMPYMMILAIAMFGAVMLIARRRKEED